MSYSQKSIIPAPASHWRFPLHSSFGHRQRQCRSKPCGKIGSPHLLPMFHASATTVAIHGIGLEEVWFQPAGTSTRDDAGLFKRQGGLCRSHISKTARQMLYIPSWRFLFRGEVTTAKSAVINDSGLPLCEQAYPDMKGLKKSPTARYDPFTAQFYNSSHLGL